MEGEYAGLGLWGNTGSVPHSVVLAGIRLLGRDMAAIADEKTGIAILEILEAEQEISSVIVLCRIWPEAHAHMTGLMRY